MLFTKLQEKYDIPSRHFLKFLQTRTFISASQRDSLTEPSLSVLEVGGQVSLLEKKCLQISRLSLQKIN